MTKTTPITDFSGDYSFLSDFSRARIDVHLIDRGRSRFLTFRTQAHAFQYLKATDPSMRERIRRAVRPAEARRLGNLAEAKMRSDWDKRVPDVSAANALDTWGIRPLIKVRMMQYLIRKKFSQQLRARLLRQTYPHELVEGNTWGDTFWGVYEGIGHNANGKLLMAVRSEIMRNGVPYDDDWNPEAPDTTPPDDNPIER